MLSRKVLVAEDNEGVRSAFGYILSDCRYNIVLVCNGREAWELLDRGEKFDIVISDYAMPEMNGIKLLQEIRADARVADIPFILMSEERVISNEDRTPLEEVCDKNSAVFLKKPFSVGELIALLEDAGSS